MSIVIYFSNHRLWRWALLWLLRLRRRVRWRATLQLLLLRLLRLELLRGDLAGEQPLDLALPVPCRVRHVTCCGVRVGAES